MKMISVEYLFGFITGSVVAFTTPLAIIKACHPTKEIPGVNLVQQGYVVPSKLEIELQDLDGNGEKETVLRYDGKQYLLKLDERGKPKIQEYIIKPAEVIPKE